MRKLFLFFLILFVLFLFGSLLLPIRLELQEELTIYNNEKIVVKHIQSLELFEKWLIAEGKTPILNKGVLYWEEDAVRFKAKIQNTTEQQSVVDIQSLDFKQNYQAFFEVKAKGNKQTDLQLNFTSATTLNPFVRYAYVFGNDKILKKIQHYLSFLKTESERIKYERFHLSMPNVELKEELVFSMPRYTTPTALPRTKTFDIDTDFKKRLLRYHILDTTKNVYLQYTKWNDSIVNYNVCIPLLKAPTKKQLWWFKKGKTVTAKGKYYTAIYKGSVADLPLAWDSLYSILKEKGISPKGLPLEEFIVKTDTCEQLKLFVQF